LHRIFVGNSKSEDQYERLSLFDNISSLIEDIKRSPQATEYAGLADNNGNVYGLLDYLRPMPATEDFPVARMMFKKSIVNVTTDEKSELSSSFDLLLNHPNERVRRIARDIAIYAYYSTYDTNNASAFFDLVPVDFRRQYDYALREGLRHQDELIDQFDATSMLATICRNYYNDDDIVPLYTLDVKGTNVFPGQRNKSTGKQIAGEFKGATITDYENHARVPSTIITPNANSKYIKIRLKNTEYLYEKIHNLQIVNDASGISTKSWYTYMLIPKLGRHYKSTHQYEFIVEGNQKSMYEQNDLPEDFDYSDALESVDKFITRADTYLKQEHKHIRKLNTNSVVVSSNIYKDDSYKSADSGIKEKREDVIVGDKKPSDLSDVDIDLTKPTQDIIEELTANNSGNISISLSGIPDISVTKAMINDYINEQVQLYISRISLDTPRSMIDEAVNKYKDEL